jgi:hypothetical protein
MIKNSIKTVLIALGCVGSAVIGGVVADLDDPKDLTGLEPITTEECVNEEINVGDVKVCLDQTQYTLVRSALKDKFTINGGVDINDFALHIGVLDNEIKKDAGFSIENFDTEKDDLFNILTNQYL